MTTPYDFDIPEGPGPNTALDPSETLKPFTAQDLGQALSAPQPPPAFTAHDLGNALTQSVPIKMDEPAPADPALRQEYLKQLQFERNYAPATAPVSLGELPTVPFFPEGSNPQIDYGRSPEPDKFSVREAMSQVPLGVLQAGGEIQKKFGGLAALVSPAGSYSEEEGLRLAKEGGQVAQQYDKLGNEMSQVPLTRELAANVVSTAPELLVGSVGGLPAMVTAFGLSAAGSAFADAKETDYEHPELYAVASGIIGAGTALLPGYKGRNVVAKAAEVIEAQPWKNYLQELISKYASGKVWATHGGAGAIQGGIQSVVQGLLNKETIDPNLTWSDIVNQGLKAAGVGGIIGEGFGALHQAEANSLKANYDKQVFGDVADYLNRNIKSAELTGGDGGARVQYEPNAQPGGTPVGYRAPEGALRRPAPEPTTPAPYPGDAARLTQLRAIESPTPEQAAERQALEDRSREVNRIAAEKMRAEFAEMQRKDAEQKAAMAIAVPPTEPVAPSATAPAAAPESDPAKALAQWRTEVQANAAKQKAALDALPLAKYNSPERYIAIDKYVASLNIPDATKRVTLLRELQRAMPGSTGWDDIRNQIINATGPVQSDVVKEGVKQERIAFLKRVIAGAQPGDFVADRMREELARLEPQAPKPVAQVTRPLELTTEHQAALKQALSAQGFGRGMEVPVSELANPNNAHLKNLIVNLNRLADVSGGTKVPTTATWADLERAGIIKVTREGNTAKLSYPEQPVTPPKGPKGKSLLQMQEDDAASQRLWRSQQPKPAAPVPVAEKPKGALRAVAPKPVEAPKVEPTKPVAPRLPNKDETIPISGDYYVTRDRRGSVVLRVKDNPNTLAKLRGNKAEAITQLAIFDDLRKQTAGERTAAWDFVAKNNPLMPKAKVQTAKEDVFGAPEVYRAKIVEVLPTTPEGAAVKQAIESGSLSHQLLVRMVTERVAQAGPEAAAKELVKQTKAASKKYLEGKLKERSGPDEDLQVPQELRNETTGENLTPAQIKAKFTDPTVVAARALSIVSGEKANQLEVENRMAAGAVTPTLKVESGSPVKVLDTEAPQSKVTTGGHVDEEVLTKFSDEDLQTNGKHDPAKERAADEVNEIKENILGGNDADYDRAKIILKGVFKFSDAKAEQWLDSDTSFLAPEDKEVQRLTNALRSVTREINKIETAHEQHPTGQRHETAWTDLVRKWALYTDGDITPETREKSALSLLDAFYGKGEEWAHVKSVLEDEAKEWEKASRAMTRMTSKSKLEVLHEEAGSIQQQIQQVRARIHSARNAPEELFGTTFAKELGKPRPFNLTPDKNGKIPTKNLKARLVRTIGESEVALLDDSGLSKWLADNESVSVKELRDWVEAHGPKVEVHTAKPKEEQAAEPYTPEMDALDVAMEDHHTMQHELETAGFHVEWRRGEDGRPLVLVLSQMGHSFTISRGMLPRLDDSLNPDISHRANRLREFWATDDRIQDLHAVVKVQETERDARVLARSGIIASTPKTHWSWIGPKSEQQMPGYVEIALTRPVESTREAVERAGGKYPDDADGVRFESSHNFPPNTLAFVRGYMETRADGSKVFHVIELQSDWAAKRAKLAEEYARYPVPESGDRWRTGGRFFPTREAAEAEKQAIINEQAGQDPRLEHYETLALKAAIEHARTEGATHIAVSDSGTVALTEGHDQIIAIAKDANGKLAWKKNEDKTVSVSTEGNAIRRITQSSKPDNGVERLELHGGGKAYIDTNGFIHITKMPFLGGDEQHYDRNLPNLLAKITGDKGQRENFGPHGKATERANRYEIHTDLDGGAGTFHEVYDRQTGQAHKFLTRDEIDQFMDRNGGTHEVDTYPRRDLTLRNPTGELKSDVTARVFDIRKVAARRSTGEPFTQGASSYFPENRLPGPQAGVLRAAHEGDFRTTEDHALYEAHGLLAPTLAEPIRRIAAGDGPNAELAKSYLKWESELEKVSLGNVGGNSKSSHYNPDTNAAKVRLGLTDPAEIEEVVMHEALHALTLRRLEMLGPDSPEYKELQRILEVIRAATPSEGRDYIVDYALQNQHELLATTISNRGVQEHLSAIADGNRSVLDSIKNWIYKFFTGKDLFTANKKVKEIFDRIMERPAVSNAEWLANYADSELARYHELRNVGQYNKVVDYRGEALPLDERLQITRKAVANNLWIKAPDVQAVLARVPETARGLLNTIFGSRDAVLEAAKKAPGGDAPMTYQQVMEDPRIPLERKAEISLGALGNLNEFDRQRMNLVARRDRAYTAFQKDLPDMDKGLTSANAQQFAANHAILNLALDLKNRIFLERKNATNQEQIDQLNKRAKMLDEIRATSGATARVLQAIADGIPGDELLNATTQKAVLELVERYAPIDDAMGKSAGVSNDTLRQAAYIVSKSNILREELLNLKQVADPTTREALLQLDRDITEDARSGDINKTISSYVSKIANAGADKSQAVKAFNTLSRQKARRLAALNRLFAAGEAVTEVNKSQSVRHLRDALTQDNQVTKPQRYLENSGQMLYTHPISREKVTVGFNFAQEGELENLRKVKDLMDAAKLYVSNPQAEGYDPYEAAFWKDFIRKADFVLDPTVSVNARKLLPAAYDPYRAVKLAGMMLRTSESVLQSIGGRAAAEADIGLQALSTVSSQLGNLKAMSDAGLTLSADKAARAHSIPIELWHREVLNPLIASRQQTGYDPLRVGGPPNIYGHRILPEDEAALATQVAFDRKVVDTATKGHGSPAVAYDPSKVTFTAPNKETLTRKVQHTGKDTMSRRLGYWADDWANAWFNDPNPDVRNKFLNENFAPVVMGHLDAVGAPDYSIKSSQSKLYKDALEQHRKDPFTSVEQLVDFLFDAQANHYEPEQQQDKEDLEMRLHQELNKAFHNVSSYRETKPSTEVGALLRVVDNDNSFTQARGNLVAPPTFYEYGLTFDHNRIARIHSALAYYTMNLAGKNGLLERLSKAVSAQVAKYKGDLQSSIKAGGLTPTEAGRALIKGTEKAQLDGKLLLTYRQAQVALREINQLRGEVERAFLSTGPHNDPQALTAVNTAQSFLASNLLMGVQSQNTNLFGGLTNLMLTNKVLLGRSNWVYTAKLLGRVMLEGGKELAAVTVAAGKHGEFIRDALRSPVFGSLGKALAEAMEAKIAQHRQMAELGLAPAVNVLNDLKALWALPTGAGRPQPADVPLRGKIGRTAETILKTITTPLSAVAPRINDRLINVLSGMHLDDIESAIKDSAVRSFRVRQELGPIAGASESLTAPEIFGRKGATEKQAELLRQMFRSQALNLDSIMRRYYEAYEKADNKQSVPFFTPEERAAMWYTVAQTINLGTIRNRPMSSRGSRWRSLLGLFWGFPSWQVARYSQLFSRLSTDKSTLKYVPTSLAALFSIAAMGASSIAINNGLKKHLYGEVSPTPSILDANNPEQASIALLSGFASYMPFFVGAAINGIAINNPMRTGFDINSQFVMLNFASDVFNSIKRVYQTHDAVRPTEDFIRRWSPLTRIFIDRMDNQAGLQEYYNVSRDLKNLAPAGMASKKRGAAGFDPTPTTPLLQDMVNAAYTNNAEAFQKASDRYIQYQQSQGMTTKEAEQALRAAWRAKDPYVRVFGRMPTGAEQAAIYANASPRQQAALDLAQQIFSSFGQMLGAPPLAATRQPASGGGGSLAPSGGGGGSLRSTGGVLSAKYEGGDGVGKGGVLASEATGTPSARAGGGLLSAAMDMGTGAKMASSRGPGAGSFKGPGKRVGGGGSLRLPKGKSVSKGGGGGKSLRIAGVSKGGGSLRAPAVGKMTKAVSLPRAGGGALKQGGSQKLRL